MENFKSVHQMEPLVMGTRTYLGQIYHAHNEDNDEDKNFNKNETLSFTQLLYLIDFFVYIFWGHVSLIIWYLLPFSMD